MKRSHYLLAGIALFTALVLCGCAWIWWRYLERDPIVRKPTIKVPSPNAYDYYMQAARIGPGTRSLSDQPALSKKVALLKKHKQCLAVLRQGLKHEFEWPQGHSELGRGEAGRCRELARVLRLESEVLAQQGEWDLAAGSHLDLIRFVEEVNRGSLIDMMVAHACLSIGHKGRWQVVPHLTSSAARKAIHRLESIMARGWSFADNLGVERWYTPAYIVETFRESGWRRNWDWDAGDDPQLSSAVERLTSRGSRLWQGHTVSKRRVVYEITRYYDDWIRRTKQSFAARVPDPTFSFHPVAEAMLSAPEMMRSMWVARIRMQSQERLFLTALALQAFRRERGRHPANLNELVPDYLKRIPPDLFATQGLLRYRRLKDGRYLLYSLGPDGKDDNGRAIRTPTGYPSGVGKDSTGDVVAGVNH